MKKILITLLLLANICSGAALAWDKHSTVMAEHDMATAGLVADVDHDHSNDVSADDHCTHGAAHVVGIFYDASLPITTVSSNRYFSALSSLASLYISPLLRPPIV